MIQIIIHHYFIRLGFRYIFFKYCKVPAVMLYYLQPIVAEDLFKSVLHNVFLDSEYQSIPITVSLGDILVAMCYTLQP